MFSFFSSLGASSQFEKHRLSFTTKTLEAPDQQALKKILKTFSGEDQQTRPQIAFATIIKKIHSSDSNKSWIYLLKNLLILDNIIGEKLFLNQIKSVQLPNITNYKQTDSAYMQCDTEQMLKFYWNLIRTKAECLANKKTVLFYMRNQRTDYLSTLTFEEVITEIKLIEDLFKKTFKVIQTLALRGNPNSNAYKSKQQFEKSKLIGYLNLQLLYFLIILYSCQLICVQRIISIICNSTIQNDTASNSPLFQSKKSRPNISKKLLSKVVTIPQLQIFRKIVIRFRTNARQIIQFVDNHKTIKGFETINYRQLDPFKGQNILGIIDQQIEQRNSQPIDNISVKPLIKQLFTQDMQTQLRVIRRLTSIDENLHFQPRKQIISQTDKQANNSFDNWNNAYSAQFPWKQILTVDLIMEIRKQQQQGFLMKSFEENFSSISENNINPFRDTIYNFVETDNLENLNYVDRIESQKQQKIQFSNIYSDLPNEWI